MGEFKIGDKVRVIKDTEARYKTGHVGLITYVKPESVSGYKYRVDDGWNNWFQASEIESINRPITEVKVGDSVYNPRYDETYKVTGVNFELETESNGSFSIPYMLKQGFTIVEPKQVTELTLDQIAEKFNIKVEDLRIKD